MGIPAMFMDAATAALSPPLTGVVASTLARLLSPQPALGGPVPAAFVDPSTGWSVSYDPRRAAVFSNAAYVVATVPGYTPPAISGPASKVYAGPRDGSLVAYIEFAGGNIDAGVGMGASQASAFQAVATFGAIGGSNPTNGSQLLNFSNFQVGAAKALP